MADRIAIPRRYSSPPNVIHLRRAVRGLLWDSVADGAVCTCYPDDTCPQCDAMLALGLGRWIDAEAAARLLVEDGRRG